VLKSFQCLSSACANFSTIKKYKREKIMNQYMVNPTSGGSVFGSASTVKVGRMLRDATQTDWETFTLKNGDHFVLLSCAWEDREALNRVMGFKIPFETMPETAFVA